MHQFDNPDMAQKGVYNSEKWARFAEILQDMDPYLELRWIPPEHRTSSQKSKAYAIVHAVPNKPAYTIMFAGEKSDPQVVLARLWEGKVSNDPMKRIQAEEAAAQAFKLSEEMAQLEEAADQVHFLATNRSPWFTKHKTPQGKIVKLDTQNGRRVG